MEIEGALVENGQLILSLAPKSRGDAFRFAYKFKPGDYDIKKSKAHRSNEQNRLMWSVIGDMARVLHEDPNEVYRDYLRQGTSFVSVRVPVEQEKAHCIGWAQRGIGWFCVKTDTDGTYSYFNDYYGTSQFDTREMSAFIDRLIQDCDAMGLDESSERLKSLLNE